MTRLEPRRFSAFNAALAACAALAAVVFGTGCEELKSRRQIQEANRMYAEGRYTKAAETYSEALQRTPDLAIGHHNAGLAYYKLFQPGVETKENRALAERSAQHFMTYLESTPDDQKVIGLLTTIWLDSGQYEKALAYWTRVLTNEPENRLVLERLANINRQAGDFEKAREWHLKRVELESQTNGKVKAYIDIATMELGRLLKPDLVDAKRLEVVDIGLAALQKAEALDPNSDQVQSFMGTFYQHRSVSHGAHWAKGVESALQRYHLSRFTEIKKAQQAAAASQQPGQGGQAAPPAGEPGSQPAQPGSAPAPTNPPAQK